MQRFVIPALSNDRTILKGELRRKVIEWRGSDPRTYKKHLVTLREFSYIEDYGAFWRVPLSLYETLKMRTEEEEAKRSVEA